MKSRWLLRILCTYDKRTIVLPMYNSTLKERLYCRWIVLRRPTVHRQIARNELDGARRAINRPSGNHRKLLEIIGICWKPQFPFIMRDWRRATGSTPAGRFFSSCSGQMDRENRNQLDTWTLGQSGTPIFLLDDQRSVQLRRYGDSDWDTS